MVNSENARGYRVKTRKNHKKKVKKITVKIIQFVMQNNENVISSVPDLYDGSSPNLILLLEGLKRKDKCVETYICR